MTKREAVELFKSEVLPVIRRKYERDGRKDRPARREAWNNWTDDLAKCGDISPRQYDRWLAPKGLCD